MEDYQKRRRETFRRKALGCDQRQDVHTMTEAMEAPVIFDPAHSYMDSKCHNLRKCHKDTNMEGEERKEEQVNKGKKKEKAEYKRLFGTR